MSTMILRFKVGNYGSWRQFFDTGQSRRATFGLFGGSVFRSADDENELMLVFDVADPRKAKEFVTSPERTTILEKSGVVGIPTHYIIE